MQKKGKTLVERGRGWVSNDTIQCSCIKASKSVLKGKVHCFKEVQSGRGRVGNKFSQSVPRPKLRSLDFRMPTLFTIPGTDSDVRNTLRSWVPIISALDQEIKTRLGFIVA